eukprot:201686-Prymnesium_polylepis.1
MLSPAASDGRVPCDVARLVLRELFDRDPSELDLRRDLVQLGVTTQGRGPVFGSVSLNRQQLEALVRSPDYRAADDGRHFVVVSLAEAETIRRILHAREGSEVIPGSTVRLALRNVTTGGSLLDVSHRWEEGPRFQQDAVLQTCRFLD